MMSPGRIEEMSLSDDVMKRFKSAFLQFLRRNTVSYVTSLSVASRGVASR